LLSQGTGCLQVIQLPTSTLTGCFKNIEGDVSCGRKCVAALMEAGGIGREKVAIPEIEQSPNT